MGPGGLHIWHLLIILLICVVIFGTKRLKDIGSDLGGAVKGFRQAMSDADREPDKPRLDRPDADFTEPPGKNSDSERHRSA
jgi:sec-independent protein translocase protein TatA